MASMSGAVSACVAFTIESALASTASETFSESLRIVITFGPRPRPCALATGVTTMNSATAIIAIRIIFFIAFPPRDCGVIRRAHIRRVPGHETAGLRLQLRVRQNPRNDKLRGRNTLVAAL